MICMQLPNLQMISPTSSSILNSDLERQSTHDYWGQGGELLSMCCSLMAPASVYEAVPPRGNTKNTST